MERISLCQPGERAHPKKNGKNRRLRFGNVSNPYVRYEPNTVIEVIVYVSILISIKELPNFCEMKSLDIQKASVKNKNMQAVRSSGSQIEVTLGKSLWRKGLRYRKNNRLVFGRPDFTLRKYKIAIFADGEFWHGKDWETRKSQHKSNVEFWHKKIERNMERDREVNKKLRENGWIVMRFWGMDIKRDSDKCAEKVVRAIASRSDGKKITVVRCPS